MTSCDMCGKEGPLFSVFIEGATMSTCEKCSATGKVLKKPVIASVIVKKKFVKPSKQEMIEVVVDNIAGILKKEREKRSMSSKEFASFLSEKESIVHKLEKGSLKPSLDMAKRYQKKLGKKLIVLEEESKGITIQKKRSTGLTMGDFIKKK